MAMSGPRSVFSSAPCPEPLKSGTPRVTPRMTTLRQGSPLWCFGRAIRPVMPWCSVAKPPSLPTTGKPSLGCRL
eukprot:11264715-Alexandrium_andersonii.AAC.1